MPGRRRYRVVSPRRSAAVRRGRRANSGIPPRRRARRRPRFGTLPVVVLLIAAAAAIYASRVLPWQLELTALSTRGTIEHKLASRGFVARTEAMVEAPRAGSIRLAVAEGERVRPGQTLAELLDLEAQNELQARLAQVEKDLLAEERESRDAREQAAAALSGTVEGYREALLGLAEAIQGGSPVAAAWSWARLDTAARQRAEAQRRLDGVKSRRLELEATRAELLASLAAGAGEIRASGQGLISWSVDGLESTTPAALAGMSSWQLLALRPTPEITANGLRVKGGQAVCRLVDATRAGLGFVLQTEDAGALRPGSQATVRFPELGGAVLRGVVTHVGPRERSGSRVVIVETDGILTGLCAARWVACEILLDSRSGVLVPRKTLTSREGQTGVLVVTRASAHFRAVTVLARSGGQVLVEGVDAGTMLAVYPWLWSLLGKATGSSPQGGPGPVAALPRVLGKR